MLTIADLCVILQLRIVSSAGLERCLDRAEATGSNPVRFTSLGQNLLSSDLSLFVCRVGDI